MIRSLFLLAASFVLMGTSCTPPLVCSNSLDGSDLGFTLVAPADFECTSSFPAQTGLIQGLVTYQKTGTSVQLIVFVGDPSSADEIVDDGAPGGGSCDDIGVLTTANGIAFERCMSTEAGTGNVSFAASANLPVGANILLVILVAEADDAGGLEDTLNTILESVAFP